MEALENNKHVHWELTQHFHMHHHYLHLIHFQVGPFQEDRHKNRNPNQNRKCQSCQVHFQPIVNSE